ncbi:hypothetical protein [Microbispora sp. NPDC049125]|uniref:hypothetical protein n=1 Tax=Microbispora sp. NPDC049125 TaxID=3154929 RepID=UPI003467570B
MKRLFAMLGAAVAMSVAALMTVLATALVTVLATASPASAGAWAVTELDPLPPAVKPDIGYTIGYWVLQHGTHPIYGSSVEPVVTGLRLTGENGKRLTYEGTSLPEPGHYAVTVKVPAGRWHVESLQGEFAPYDIGTLAVPGGLTLSPPMFPPPEGIDVTDYWGAVKPPGFPWKAVNVVPGPTPAMTVAPARPAAMAPATATAAASPAARAAVPAEVGSSPLRQPYMLVLAVVAGVAGTLLAQRFSAARVRRGPGGHPAGGADEAGGTTGPAEPDDVITLGGGRKHGGLRPG